MSGAPRPDGIRGHRETVGSAGTGVSPKLTPSRQRILGEGLLEVALDLSGRDGRLTRCA